MFVGIDKTISDTETVVKMPLSKYHDAIDAAREIGRRETHRCNADVCYPVEAVRQAFENGCKMERERWRSAIEKLRESLRECSGLFTEISDIFPDASHECGKGFDSITAALNATDELKEETK